MNRELFACEALAQIPKLLTLLDRNPHSPTFGCFDRNFWHYRIIDFPSGMAQEFVWPLALVYTLDLPRNQYYQQPAVRDWVEAGINFAARSSRSDGSCDDYFPFERAAGAAAFSLLACVESYRLLGLSSDSALSFFEKRAGWIASHDESGRLANHQALAALGLELVSRLINAPKLSKEADRRLERVLSWQSTEGWFAEYDGFDPGYQTLTVSCLARLYQMKPSTELRAALERAVQLVAAFVHPDGSYGGEYGSRNTKNFFPHGFELVGQWMPESLSINDSFLKGMEKGLVPCYSDDHIVGHHAWNYLLAWQDFVEQRPKAPAYPQGRRWFREAGLLIDRRGASELVVSLNKGGAFKFFRGESLVASDTHLSLLYGSRGHLRNAVGHITDRYKTAVGDDVISVAGSLGWAKQTQMTPFRLLTLRLGMLTLGRLFPNAVRSFLQRLLISGKKRAPFDFSRELRWEGEKLKVKDTLTAPSWKRVRALGIGCDQTSIYVVMSRTFEANELKEWTDLTPLAEKKQHGEKLEIEREF